MNPVLEVENLSVTFQYREGDVAALRNVSLRIDPGESLGVVGESGSGKSLTSAAIMGLLPNNASVTGSVRFLGQELLGAPESTLRDLRGRRLAIISQDALTALNPVHTVGAQIAEAIRVHDSSHSRAELRARAIELLDLVGIPQPSTRVDNYPHEFSGGMRQRALIAMSVANEPDLIIADEPTTALDVTVQAQVLDVLARIQARTSSSLMLITHDLGVVAGVADRVLVMYSGSVVEEAGVDDLFYKTTHPYTRGLLASLPRLDARDRSQPLYRIPGFQPAPVERPPGCPFHPRCDVAVAGLCDVERPLPIVVRTGHVASCHRAEIDGPIA
ncbi:MAG: ABC transporter ATP-binding protein [Actinomycetes bacterium]